jgi:PadR family transcriptional regulator, regulatory protein PadR
MCASDNCNCDAAGPKVEGFIVPCILFLLRENPAHGYEIMEKLGNLPFLDSIPDPSVVYRHLRNLEEEGKVESELVPGSGGPARKVYSMTPGGEDYLKMWILKIKRRKKSLESFLAAYEKAGPER